jgi:hypothetical protein
MRNLRIRWYWVAATLALPAVRSVAEEPAQLERFVVNDKHLLSFGIALNLWEDKASGRVLEMHVTGVQDGGMAEQEGVVAGTRVYGINGRDICSFLATFASGSELNDLFVNRPRGDRVTLEVVKPGHRKTEFVNLVNEQGFKLTIRTKAAASGVALRAEEKSGVYSGLRNWERKSIDGGVIAAGFTPDMVYIALGEPTDRASKGDGDEQVELWTYRKAYPDPEAVRGFEAAVLTLDSAAGGQNADGKPGKTIGLPPKTKYGTAAVRAYDLQVLFEGGKVSRMAATPIGG